MMIVKHPKKLNYKSYLVLFCMLCVVSNTLNAENVIRYGAQPFVPPIQLERIYGPLVKELSAQIKKPVQFRTRSTLQSYSDAIKNEEFDIILVNPFLYTELRNKSPYLGLVQRNSNLKGVFFVIDRELDKLDKLRSKIIGFPPKSSAIAILSLQKLKEAGLEPADYQHRYFKDHLSCKQALSNSQIHACVSSPHFEKDRSLEYNKVFIGIATTREIPSSVIMIHKRLQQEEEKIRLWFLSLNTTEKGRKLLNDTFLGELGEVVEDDYNKLQ